MIVPVLWPRWDLKQITAHSLGYNKGKWQRSQVTIFHSWVISENLKSWWISCDPLWEEIIHPHNHALLMVWLLQCVMCWSTTEKALEILVGLYTGAVYNNHITFVASSLLSLWRNWFTIPFLFLQTGLLGSQERNFVVIPSIPCFLGVPKTKWATNNYSESISCQTESYVLHCIPVLLFRGYV